MMKDVLVNGVPLSVWQTKNYPGKHTIIFLHDSLGCIELWRDFPEKLGAATQCDVLVYDRQGYGKSAPFTAIERSTDYLETEAEVLQVLMKECGVTNAILFGHSDGGSIALIAGAKYPGIIKGVITEGAHIFVEEVTLSGIRAAVHNYNTTNLVEKLQKYHGKKADAVFHAWANTWLHSDYRNWNIEHLLPHITCPALVIQGDEDEYGSMMQVNGIIRQVSGHAQKLLIPNIGHSPHKEATEVVLAEAGRFIMNVISDN